MSIFEFQDGQDFSVLRVNSESVSEEDARACVAQLLGYYRPKCLLFLDLTRVIDISVDALRIVAGSIFQNAELKVALIAPIGILDLVKHEGLQKAFMSSYEDASGLDLLPSMSSAELKPNFDKFVSTCIDTAIEVFHTIAHTKVHVLKMEPQNPMRAKREGDYGFFAQLISKPFRGTIILSFSNEILKVLVARAFALNNVNHEIAQSGGTEFLNNVLGGIRSVLNNHDYQLEQTVPTPLEPEHLSERSMVENVMHVIFSSELGEFDMELCVTYYAKG